MSDPENQSSSKNELSKSKDFTPDDAMGFLAVLPKEEQQAIARKQAEGLLDVDKKLYQKASQAKLANAEMDRMIDRVNDDTEGKISIEQEFQTGTGKAKITTKAVSGDNLMPVLVVIGIIILLIVLLK
ncbi:hypothetical protein OAH64_00660 [bacterium]|nr:hypothetical protein [bacterium]